GFVPDLTGRENIYLAAGLHGMSRKEIDPRFDAIVDFAEIHKFLDSPYRHYSSGMQVRLPFPVFSQLEVPILIVAEVLVVGDKAIHDKCNFLLDVLFAAGRTMFLVTHNNVVVQRFCTRGLYLRGGELRADGPLDDVLDLFAKE